MTTHVELVYDRDCPNVDAARAALCCAFVEVGATPAWVEWDLKALDSPAYVCGYGSPTILVNGKDVAGAGPSADADCCRLYSSDAGGGRGVPPVEQVVAAMRKGNFEPSVTQKETKP